MTGDDLAALRQQLIAHEGLRLKPYVDTVGKITIGVGHNLTDNGITHEQAMAMLDEDIAVHVNGLLDALPWTADLDAPRFRVLADIAFNVGVHGLLQFTKMLRAVQAGDFRVAAAEILNSKLAPARAQRLAALMQS